MSTSLVTFLLPDVNNLGIDELSIEEDGIIMKVHALQTDADCPLCHQIARREHSHYYRTVADLSVIGKPLHLKLYVRRFFCDNPDCQRQTFAERFPAFLLPFARRTQRLAHQQRHLGLALGGEAGARELSTLAMPLSADTLLRLIRAVPQRTIAVLHVVGIDDWAWRKGQSYGTILVDLETHQVVDLLADRSAESVRAWFEAHPGITIVSRDRGAEYIEGISQGAPQATQVADRWHLLHNLREALERLLEQNRGCLAAAAATPQSVSTPVEPITDSPMPPVALTKAEQRRQTTRQKRLARYEAVLELHQQGLAVRAITRQLKIGRKTVVRYLQADGFPEMAQRRKRASLLDPYMAHLQQRWQAGCHNGCQLYREIQDQGYTGSRSLLSRWIAQMRKQAPTLLSTTALATVATPAKRPWAARCAVWLLLKDPLCLSSEHKEALERMLAASPIVRQAYHFGQAFLRIVRERFSKSLEPWLTAVQLYRIPELISLARGLTRDKTAVLAALTLPWSNGQTEGQVNRLKLIKRQMYGRAKFDLLRARVLGA